LLSPLYFLVGGAKTIWKLKWKLTEALLEELEPDAKLVLVK